jgi:hypothetical protein
MKMCLAWGDLAEIGEDHSLNQKLLHLSSLLFLMQLPWALVWISLDL